MKIKVLLVDDAEDFVHYMKKRLLAQGLEVSVTYSGEEALAMIREESFDVVVLDVLMPGIDGIEVLQKIKQMEPKIQVIILTGHGTVETAAEGMKLGAADYILKPCNFNTLCNSIQDTYYKTCASNS